MKAEREKEMISAIAAAVMLAQKISEESWDAQKHIYTKNQNEAAKEACKQLGLPPELAEVIYYLNSYVWNDIQEWATSIIK